MMYYLEKENNIQNNHLDDEYLYDLWVLECQM
jgi:hypothetical protein